MPDGKISTMFTAALLDGSELVEVTQNGETRVTTTQKIANLGTGAPAAAELIVDKARVYFATARNTSTSLIKMDFDAVDYNSGTIWNTTNKRFEPTQAGYYLVNASIYLTGTGTTILYVYKNGTIHALVGAPNVNRQGTGGATIVYCNGTTDYLEIYVDGNGVDPMLTGVTGTSASLFGPI